MNVSWYSKLTRSLLLLVFFSAVLLYSIVFNNSTGWLLLYFSFFILAADFFSLLSSLKKIQAEWSNHQRYTVQQPDQVEFELFRYRPTLMRVPFLTISLKEIHSSTVYHSLYDGRSLTCSFEWTPVARGIQKEMTLQLISNDLLGLFSKSWLVPVEGPFVVLPQFQSEAALNLYQQLTAIQPNLTLLFGNQTFSIRNFRSYQPGDALRMIDWKQSGKRNELISKEFEQENEVTLHLVFYGKEHLHFEEILSLYYSFIQLPENTLLYQQTILAETSEDVLEEYYFAALEPLKETESLPLFHNQYLILFVPERSVLPLEELERLERTNEVLLVSCLDDGYLLSHKTTEWLLNKEGKLNES